MSARNPCLQHKFMGQKPDSFTASNMGENSLTVSTIPEATRQLLEESESDGNYPYSSREEEDEKRWNSTNSSLTMIETRIINKT